jgi:hypothetical protein
MPNPRRTAAELQQAKLIAFLQEDNARMAAALAALQAPAEPYIALCAVDHPGYHETTVLRWCARGLVDSKREGSRWFCKQSSVYARIKRLTGE